MPTLDAANIAFNLLRVATKSIALGPMLLGADRPVHIVTPSATVRTLLNMSAIAVVDSVKNSTPRSAPSTRDRLPNKRPVWVAAQFTVFGSARIRRLSPLASCVDLP